MNLLSAATKAVFLLFLLELHRRFFLLLHCLTFLFYLKVKFLDYILELLLLPYSVTTQESLRSKRDKNIIINILGSILCLFSLENKILKKVFIYFY